MRETILCEKLPGRKVRCNVCAVRCVIAEGQEGICRTRINRAGVLYTLIYNRVSAIHADPIEKKPLYHFYPGSRILSLGTLGCNFRCPGCQNWEISHAGSGTLEMGTVELTADQTLDLIKENHCSGVCWTYNDPSIWLEYTLEGARLAKQHGYYAVYITNGFTTPEALDIIGPYLDAFRVDLKGFEAATYKKIAGLGRVEKILEAAARAKGKWGMHVECVTNVTPGINDSPQELQKIAMAIKTELGVDTPWHLTRFYPYLDLAHLNPTPLSTLERAVEIGREAGLWYVYIGNVPNHLWENTYCHVCQALLIKREGYLILENSLLNGRCPACHTVIPGRFV